MPNKILIIVNKGNSNTAINDKLTSFGFDISTISQSMEAIKQACALKPDLIILDLGNSSDVGLLILERLKLLADTREISILVLTGTGWEDKDKVLKFSVEGYLEGLYSPNGVVTEVKRIFKKRRARKKIVVVDDDPVLVKMLTSRISANGYDTIGITDSTEAINSVYREDPDLILTDIVMPNVSGWKITEELKSSKEYKDLPIILLSALITEDFVAEKYEIVDYFMSKPPVMEKLLAKIKELLTKKG